MLLDVARAKEAYALLKEGVLSGLSIGYSPRRYRMDPDTGVRLLAELDLWEVSLVTFPANDAAQVSVVKQAVPEDNTQDDPRWGQYIRSGKVMRLAHELERATRLPLLAGNS